MIPTPDLSHLTADDYDCVYEPAEDTFLLLDALEADEQELKQLRPRITLEIGSGSGCVSAFIAKILGPSVLYLCTDINPHACRCTLSTGVQNKVALDPINVTFAAPLSLRLKRSVDVILFNPPYVPTIPDEASGAQDARGIAGAWAGGVDGMNVTDVFLERVEDLMSDRGRFYLVAIAENDVPGIQERMLRLHGLQSDIILSRRAGREHLFVLRFVRDLSRVCS
ncbi:hypothetical protein D9615_005118 [Tricholomella constricta]|uniref:Methyltransferase small domain-containing protein n=1 Tax=Tricholomella constricta TaxID=117010 RepID=A0A8H5H6V7_9AGAR|nr:hypothetical protein D9615_005118 [Tricholomella constricta]